MKEDYLIFKSKKGHTFSEKSPIRQKIVGFLVAIVVARCVLCRESIFRTLPTFYRNTAVAAFKKAMQGSGGLRWRLLIHAARRNKGPCRSVSTDDKK